LKKFGDIKKLYPSLHC